MRENDKEVHPMRFIRNKNDRLHATSVNKISLSLLDTKINSSYDRVNTRSYDKYNIR